jgi:uncharacterized glyoxalase superfamily protein PhnB
MSTDDGLPSIYPTLCYPDIPAALRFLTGVVGFTEHAVARDDDGEIIHAELRWGNGLVMVSPGKPGDSPFSLGPSCIYLAIDDPDAHHDRAVAAGADIVMGLTDQDYGSREFALRDSAGNVWCFGTYQPGPGVAPH